MALHRGWAKQILTTDNPYTGRALAREPALAIVELVNEDSLFFWTLSRKTIENVRSLCLREQMVIDHDIEDALGRWINRSTLS